MKTKDLTREILQEQYNKHKSVLKVAKELGVNRETLRYHFRKFNILTPQRKFRVNESYFKKIDTREKAYWLGFLYADGCLLEPKRGLRVELAIKDKHHLEKFRDCLESDYKVYEYNYTNHCSAMLNISSPIMYQDFKGWLKRTQVPIISQELYKDFLRGIFDGDGSLYYYPKYKTIRICILGLKSFLKDYQIFAETDIFNSVYQLKNANICEIRVCGKRAIKFLHWLYDDTPQNIRLERKYLKFYKILSFIKGEQL